MVIFELLDPPLENRAELILFFAGSGLCLSFMLSDPSKPHIWFFLAALTALRAVRRSRIARAIRLCFLALYVYEAIAFGLLLGWTTPLWVRVLTPLLLLFRWPIRGVRIPLPLALGPFILMCLLGWRHQDGMLRCEDLHRVKAQAGVSILAPTFPEEKTCAGGDTYVVGRYPRRVWEAPEAGRFLVTTQFYRHFTHSGQPLQPKFSGSICEVKLGESPRCFGEGTAQAIGVASDRLYIGAYHQLKPGHRGVVYAVDKSDFTKVLQEKWFRDDTGEFYYDAPSDELGLLDDRCTELLPVRASDLSPKDPIAVRFCPGETRFHDGEGIFCFGPGLLATDGGHGFASIAFRAGPFRHRLLAPSNEYPSTFASLTWGCDFDPVARRAFVASANLGWLGFIDYDSGRYLARHFVGIGVRAIAWDAPRRVAWLADFLRGEVFGVDPESGREVARWFVGRFVRQLVLSRDGRSLFATSTAGLIRIELPTVDR